MYKFVKIKPKNYTKDSLTKDAFYNRVSGGTWYFVPNSVEQVKEHFNKIFGQEIKAGVHDKVTGYKHASTPWRHAVDMITMFNLKNLENNHWLFNATLLENEVLNNRIKDFEKGKDIYLADGVVQFSPSWDMYEIVEEKEMNELIYPREAQYHLDEVRYMQWDVPGVSKGVHWYAKVGNFDIVDEKGNQKWDTKEEAMAAAEWFCQELNYKINFAKSV